MTADAKNTANFSAVAYAFGTELRKRLNVPVGLVGVYWGGTRIEAWTPAGAQPTVGSPANNAAQQRPSALYNGMVHPWKGYALRGMLWYQGESNCIQKDGALYAERMKALIGGWRAAWGQGDFPCYFVQLAPFQYVTGKPDSPSEQDLPMLWDAQSKAASEIAGAAVAHTADIGNWNDIHPTNKKPVGERLARLALSRTYGVKFNDDTGPEFKSFRVENGKIAVSFDRVTSGLHTRDSQPPVGFEIAEADGSFAPATAEIQGDTIILTSPQVTKPTQVRLGWMAGVDINLVNGEGIPAFPFLSKAQ
jgi:sialate O-acetylesterase